MRWRPKPPSRRQLAGWALALLTTCMVTINQQEVGIARDEVVYFGAGSAYAHWWLGLVTFDHGISKQSITQTFGGAPGGGGNSEHPPLVKTLMGLSHRILHDKLGICGELTAYRLPGAVLAGVLVLLVYSLTLAVWGFAEAVLAALCMMLLPRALFHAGLACFDAPITTSSVLLELRVRTTPSVEMIVARMSSTNERPTLVSDSPTPTTTTLPTSPDDISDTAVNDLITPVTKPSTPDNNTSRLT
jgi:hypothetical protein